MLWSDNFMIPKTTDKADLRDASSSTSSTTRRTRRCSPPRSSTSHRSTGSPTQLTAMGGDAAKLVDNPLVNPTDEFLAPLVDLRPARAPAEEEKFDKRFSEITGTG